MTEVTHYFFNDTIGVVRCETDDGEVIFYSKAIKGLSLEEDIQAIAQWGNTFPTSVGNSLMDGNYMTTFDKDNMNWVYNE